MKRYGAIAAEILLHAAFIGMVLFATGAFGQAKIRMLNEGNAVGYVNVIDCVGAGVTCAVSGSEGTLTIGLGAGLSGPITDDSVWVGDGANPQEEVIPNCVTTGRLLYTAATNTFSCGAVYNFSDLAGTASDAQVPNTITLDNITQITTRNFSSMQGTVSDSQLANDYSGVGSCPSSNWVRVLNDNAGPTCTQPGFNDIGGVALDAQLLRSYSGVGVCGANTWASTLTRDTAPTCTQPGFTNLSGNIAVSQVNSGTSASSGTVFRGDNVWASGVSGGWTVESHIDVGNTTASVDFIDFGGGEATYPDYTMRISHDTGGANANSEIRTRGTGSLSMGTNEAGVLNLFTTGTTRLQIAGGGAVTVSAPSTSNASGFTSTGNGSGHGVVGNGGSGDGFGGLFLGGNTNGRGLTAAGAGTGVGVHTTGGASANGINAFGGSGGATAGIEATGGPGGNGGYFNNGTAATGGTRRDAIALTNGDMDLSGVTYPTSTTAISERVTVGNIINAWAKIEPGDGTCSVNAGFNIASCSESAGTITVTTASAFASSADVAILATSNDGDCDEIVASQSSTTAFTVQCRNSAGTLVDPGVDSFRFSIMFLGAQ